MNYFTSGMMCKLQFTDVKQSIICGVCTEATGIVFHIFKNANREFALRVCIHRE